MRFRSLVSVLAVSCSSLLTTAGAQGGMSTEEARALATQSVQHELLYLGAERKYTCTYQMTVRTYDPANYSRPPVFYTADLFTSNTGQVQSDIASVAAPARVLAAHQYHVTFPTDILKSVLQHSILENVDVETKGGQAVSATRTFVRFSFHGDPTFTPQNYVDSVAHALRGRMVLDATDALLVLVDGVAGEDTTENGRLLVRKGIPILDFQAALFDGVFLPLRFSAASFTVVPDGPRASQRWNEHLTRVFGQRQNCQEFHVHSTIRGAAPEEHSPPK